MLVKKSLGKLLIATSPTSVCTALRDAPGERSPPSADDDRCKWSLVPVAICWSACTSRNLLTSAGDSGPPPAELPLKRWTPFSTSAVVCAHCRLSVGFCVLRLDSASRVLPPEADSGRVIRRPMVAPCPCCSSHALPKVAVDVSTIASTESGASGASPMPTAPATPAALAWPAPPAAPATLSGALVSSVAPAAQLICLQLPRWLVLSCGLEAAAEIPPSDVCASFTGCGVAASVAASTTGEVSSVCRALDQGQGWVIRSATSCGVPAY